MGTPLVNAAGGLTITTVSLPVASQGVPYSQTLAASGGSGTYVEWTVVSGALPAFNAGPLPLPGLALNYTGIVQGMPVLSGSGSVTIQVRDSAGATAQKTFPWTVNAEAAADTWEYSAGNPQPTYIDPAQASQFAGPNAWAGGSGQAFLLWNARKWIATVPPAYASGGVNGYPYGGRGWYPQVPNPCDPDNGGSSSSPGVQSALKISSIAPGSGKAKLRKIINLPNDRTVSQYDQLEDMYIVGTADPAGGRTSGYASPSEILASISVFTGFLDTAQYWEYFVGTANATALAKATLSSSDYSGSAPNANVAARIELDGRMWFVALTNETWAKTPSSGLYNTIRIFPSPWNELHQLGGMYLYVDMGELLRDLLSSSVAGYLTFSASDYLSGLFAGVEPDGLSIHYTLSAATTANPLIITVTTVGTNPFSVNDRVGFASVGGMAQLDAVVGTVSAIGGSSGAFTATLGDVDASGFSTYTSGGYAHKAVMDFDIQTAMQTEPDPLIYTVPELAQNVSRQPTRVSVSSSPDMGGALIAANAVTANYDAWWQSSAQPSSGTPVYFGMNFNGLSSDLKEYGLVHVIGVYNVGSGNNGFYLGGGGPSYWLPGTYTIDGNPSSSSTYPTSGWTTLATVTGNLYRERATVIGDWSAYNWLRINCTSLAQYDTQGSVAFHIDVLNAPNTTGECDGWFFLGDSHLNKYMLAGDTEEGGASDYFGSMLMNYTGHIGWGICAGNSGWTLCPNSASYPATLPYLNSTDGDWIADFPGRYVWYGLGYNDPAASVSQSTYETDLTWLVNHVLSLGKKIVIPSIMYTLGDSGATSTTWSGYNASVLASFSGNPNVIAGPDLNTLFGAIKNFAWNSHDGIHLAPYGQAVFRGVITDWIARVIYLGQDPTTWKMPFKLGTGTYGMGGLGGTG